MMKNVRFAPWVGSAYTMGIEGKRMMALGESHYCANPCDADSGMTNRIIRLLFEPDREHEGFMNTYTKFERALAGKPLSLAEKEQWWNRILFYNYVQSPISGPRKEPTRQEFADSEAAFFEVLETYRPDGVLVWGKRLYDNLPKRGRQLDDLILPDGDSIETWAYDLHDGHTVRLLPITHPSAAFTTGYWHVAISTFIRDMK